MIRAIGMATFLHSPNLDTVLMVEKAVYDAKSDLTATQIWRKLPKKVLWTTYTTILDYLNYSGKILADKDKTLIWIYNPRLMERVKKEGARVA